MVRVPHSAGLSPLDNTFSVALRAKVQDEWGGTFLSKGGSFGWSIHRMRFRGRPGGWWNLPVPEAKGRWIHLAFTYDGTTGRYYIDGREVFKGDKTLPLTPTTGDLLIGGTGFRAGRKGKAFPGFLDDVRFYNTVLTPEAVRALAGPRP